MKKELYQGKNVETYGKVTTILLIKVVHVKVPDSYADCGDEWIVILFAESTIDITYT